MSYFNMCSRITIQSQKGVIVIGSDKPNQRGSFAGVESIQIKKSVKEMGDSCKLIAPRHVYLPHTQTTLKDLIRTGDKIKIELGYDYKLNTEFVGYIREINVNSKIEIEIDDEMYPLRNIKVDKSYKSVTLRQLLTDIAPGYKIQCPDVVLGKYIVHKSTAFQELKAINDKYGFYSFLSDGILHTQYCYDVRGFGKENTYYLSDDMLNNQRVLKANTVSSDLKYRFKDTRNVRVEVVVMHPSGHNFSAIVGSKDKDANIHKLRFGVGMPNTTALKMAENMLNNLNFDGYTGSITGFGLPLTQPGDSLNLIDFEFPERNGKYLIDTVDIDYNESGFRRRNSISYKV